MLDLFIPLHTKVGYDMFSVCLKRVVSIWFGRKGTIVFQYDWWLHGKFSWITKRWIHRHTKTISLCFLWTSCWINLKAKNNIDSLMVFELQSHLNHPKRSSKYHVHMSLWEFCIQMDAIWVMQCICHFPQLYNFDLLIHGGGNYWVFMNDFSIMADSIDCCLDYLADVLKICKDWKFVQNLGMCHFMVKEGIVLGHRISSKSIEVNRAKVELIESTPPLSP